MDKVTVRVPGKRFVAGEYAVVRPGGQALVAAIETDFRVSVSESQGSSRLHTNVGLADFEFHLADVQVDLQNPWRFALAALESLLLPMDKEILIEIQSDLGYGPAKKGYGSSASVVVGVMDAVNQFFALGLSLEARFKLAAAAHYQVQGSGSMGDVAAITYGGLVHYHNQDKAEQLSFPWKPYVVRTSESVKTGEKLGVDFSEDFYKQSDALVEQLAVTQDFPSFKRLMIRSQQLLIDALPAAYVTEKLAFALNLVAAHPALVGKISGSGFGENLVIFSDSVSDQEMAMLGRTLAGRGITLEKLKVSAPVLEDAEKGGER